MLSGAVSMHAEDTQVSPHTHRERGHGRAHRFLPSSRLSRSISFAATERTLAISRSNCEPGGDSERRRLMLVAALPSMLGPFVTTSVELKSKWVPPPFCERGRRKVQRFPPSSIIAQSLFCGDRASASPSTIQSRIERRPPTPANSRWWRCCCRYSSSTPPWAWKV